MSKLGCPKKFRMSPLPVLSYKDTTAQIEGLQLGKFKPRFAERPQLHPYTSKADDSFL